MKEIILPQEETFLESFHKELIECSYYAEFCKKFDDLFIKLFNFSFKLRGIVNTRIKNTFLKFDEVFELLWKIEIFPVLLAKSIIRFYYYYTLCDDEGLDYENFISFINIVGIIVVRNGKNYEQKMNSVLKEKKNQNLNYILGYYQS